MLRVSRLISSVLLAAIGFFASAHLAFAATLTSVTSKPATLQTSQAANQLITFTTPTGASATQTISVTFNADFDTSTIVEDDIDITDDSVDLTTSAAACPAAETSVAIASDIVTFTLCAGTTIAAGSVVTIEIGTNATSSGTGVNRITNPSSTGTFYVSIGGSFGDSGSIAYPINGDDSVAVSATVTTGGGGGGAPDPGGGGGGGGDTTAPVISTVVVTTITTTGATVTWETNEASDSLVEYGLTESYGLNASSGSLVNSHSIPLTGLTEGTTYHFRIRSADVSGNAATSVDFTFTTLDQTPPVISAVTVSDITQSGATVSWNTDESATSVVEYGLSDSYGASASVSGLDSTHAVGLSGLTAGTLYHFRVVSDDASSNRSVSEDGTFTTVADDPPGNVSNLEVVAGNTTNELSWINPPDADLAAIRVVACTDTYPSGPTDTTGCSVVSDTLDASFAHTGLTNGRPYFYGVFARDAAGQYASGVLDMATPNGPDAAPGNVSNVRVSVANERVTLTWTNPTDPDLVAVRILTCINEFPSGPDDVSGCSVVYESLGTSFTQTGLTNGQTYYFGVYAKDAIGQFAGGFLVSAIPSAVNAPPGPVSNLSAVAGDGRVTLNWVNPSDADVDAVRVIVCTGEYPSSPADTGGSCAVVSDTVTEQFTHAGLANDVTVYYGVYVHDDVGQYSTGAFRSATPSALAAACGDDRCNGNETALSCPADCGASGPVCGNQVCEADETADRCPADCGLIPACGNAQCDAGETADSCPADCPADLPGDTVPADRRITLDDVTVSVLQGKIILTPINGSFRLLAGKNVSFIVRTNQLSMQPERVQLSFGSQTYNLIRRENSDGTSVYVADVPVPFTGARYSSALSVFYADGRTQTVSYVSVVVDLGLVYEMEDDKPRPLPDAVVTLLVGSGGNQAWDSSPFDQENPHITGNTGTFGWHAPNGTYRIRAEKSGYDPVTTRALTITDHIVAQGMELKVTKPLLPAVIETVQDIIDSPAAQQAADVTTPVVVAAVVANTAALAVGFNLISYLRYITTAPVLLFSRRKRKGYGIVYNSITKVPVDLAIVRLFRINEAQPEAPGQLVSSRVTDKGGRYFFLAQPGVYRLTATKPNFKFPSTYLGNLKDDGLFLDVYHTEPIRVTGSSASIAANIPLDPVEAAVTPKSVIWRKRFRTFQNTVAILGNIGAIGVLIIQPSVFTAAMAGVQLAMYALIRRLAAPKKPVNWGIVYDTRTGRPLSNVVARIFEPKYNKLLETSMTDSRGRFTFLLGPNEYYAVFEKEGFDSHVIRPIDYTKKTEPSELAAKVSLSPATKTSVPPTTAADLLPPPTSAPPEPAPVVAPDAPQVAVKPSSPSELFTSMPEPPPVTTAPKINPLPPAEPPPNNASA